MQIVAPDLHGLNGKFPRVILLLPDHRQLGSRFVAVLAVVAVGLLGLGAWRFSKIEI